MRLAVCGPSRVGKTALALYMAENFGWHHMRYNDLLKQWLVDAINEHRGDIELPDLTVEDMLRDKEKYRHLQQIWGDMVGFNEGNGVMEAVIDWQHARTHKSQPVIFDNVRFQAQYELLKPYGFVLVKLEPPKENEYLRRPWTGYDPMRRVRETDMHPAENQPLVPDITLDANNRLEDIADVLLRLSGQVRAVSYEAA